jgi:hypothetical protein
MTDNTVYPREKQKSLPPISGLDEFVSVTSGQGLFLLIDCVANDEFISTLDEYNVPDSDRFRIPVHTKKGGSLDPLLVSLNAENSDPLIKLALYQGMLDAADSPLGSRQCCAVVSSPSKPELIVKCFSKVVRYYSIPRIPNVKPTTFRFFDPRVMHTIQRLFSWRQVAMMLGPITYWGYIDFRGIFRLIKNPSPRTLVVNIVVQPEQEAVLQRNATVQRALKYLFPYRREWPENLDAELDDNIALAPKALHEAHIVNRSKDLAAYAALVWLCDTDRVEKPYFEEVMAEFHKLNGAAPLESIVSSLTPNVFK